jgi:hypothetical protein
MILYKTKNLNLACVLIILGHQLQGINKDQPRMAEFVFNDTSEIQKNIEKYFNKQLSLEPVNLFNNLKELKMLIYR